jgi:hypothetical protein
MLVSLALVWHILSKTPTSVLPHDSAIANLSVSKSYPQVLIIGDSIAERSFENGDGYGARLSSMVRETHVRYFLVNSRGLSISTPERWTS